MSSNTDFQHEATLLLGRLKQKKDTLQREHELRMAEVDRQIESVMTTLRLLRESGEAPQSITPMTEIDSDRLIASLSTHKTIRAALIAMAEAMGGVIRIVDAKVALIAAGIIKRPKNAWGAIYTTLSRSPEFEKVPGQSGTFRLVTQQTMLPVAS